MAQKNRIAEIQQQIHTINTIINAAKRSSHAIGDMNIALANWQNQIVQLTQKKRCSKRK